MVRMVGAQTVLAHQHVSLFPHRAFGANPRGDRLASFRFTVFAVQVLRLVFCCYPRIPGILFLCNYLFQVIVCWIQSPKS